MPLPRAARAHWLCGARVAGGPLNGRRRGPGRVGPGRGWGGTGAGPVSGLQGPCRGRTPALLDGGGGGIRAMAAEARVSRWYFGGLASCGAACCTHPLDLVKVSAVLGGPAEKLCVERPAEVPLAPHSATCVTLDWSLGLSEALSPALLRTLVLPADMLREWFSERSWRHPGRTTRSLCLLGAKHTHRETEEGCGRQPCFGLLLPGRWAPGSHDPKAACRCCPVKVIVSLSEKQSHCFYVVLKKSLWVRTRQRFPCP